MNKEFTFLGNTMENVAMIYGIFLIVWGIGVTTLSDSQSITSLIPAIFGLPILISSFIAKKLPNIKKGINAYRSLNRYDYISWRIRYNKRINSREYFYKYLGKFI